MTITADGIYKSFNGFPALRGVNLAASRGEFVALLGPSGSGKTTLLRILAGLSRPARGRVRILGADVRRQDTRQRIGVLGHGIGVYEELSAFENLRLFARLYGMADPVRTALSWLERTGLDPVKDGLVREFSRGMRQRLAVARAFLHEPSVLLLDEPFTALDDRAIGVLQGLLAEARARGATIVLSTHQLREALELATHALLLVRGRTAFFGERTPEMAADPAWLYRRYGEN